MNAYFSVGIQHINILPHPFQNVFHVQHETLMAMNHFTLLHCVSLIYVPVIFLCLMTFVLK